MSASSVKNIHDAKGIRQYIRTMYFEPARRRRETLVTLRAGDIHRELGLHNRVPNVCQVMESRILEKEAGVRVSSKHGPPSGRGTTLTVTYTVDLHPALADLAPNEQRPGEAKKTRHRGVEMFLALRGSARKLFAAEGGGESWLKKERAQFYSSSKKDLK